MCSRKLKTLFLPIYCKVHGNISRGSLNRVSYDGGPVESALMHRRGMGHFSPYFYTTFPEKKLTICTVLKSGLRKPAGSSWCICFKPAALLLVSRIRSRVIDFCMLLYTARQATSVLIRRVVGNSSCWQYTARHVITIRFDHVQGRFVGARAAAPIQKYGPYAPSSVSNGCTVQRSCSSLVGILHFLIPTLHLTLF